MPAITLTDLTNAKTDTDHIAEIATSLLSTATDRLGHVKSTMQGAVDSLKAFNPRGAWVTATAYAIKDVYLDGTIAYATLIAHTSTSVAADLAAGKVGVHQGLTNESLNPASGADVPGFSPLQSYRAGSVGAELTKRGAADNFPVDDFFRWATVPADLKPIFIVGDSITEGSRSDDWKVDNYASIIRSAVLAKYKNKNFGFANFNFVSFEAYPSATLYAHNCTRSGFGVVYPFQDTYFGGTMVQSLTAAEYVEVTYTGRDARLVYVQEAVNGTILEVKLDGVVVGTIDTKSPSSVLIAGYSVGGAYSEVISANEWKTHVIRLTNTENKSAKICGMVYLEHGGSAPFGPAVFNLGRSSITLCDIPDAVLLGYASSATVILSLGVNDDNLGRPIATFRAKLALLLGHVQTLNGCAVVCDFIFSKPASNLFKTALRELAYQYNFPYLDFSRMWAGADVAANQYAGYLSWDGVHPTTQGHEHIANTIMRTVGLSYDKGSFPALSGPPWELPIAGAGWTSLGSGYAVLRFTKTREGLVSLQGLITNPTGAAAYSTIFNLPPGYRPAAKLLFIASFNHGLGEIEIGANGDVCLGQTASSAGGFVSLSGLTWPSEV